MLDKKINGILSEEELDNVSGGLDIGDDTRSARCKNPNCSNCGNRVLGPLKGPIVCPECLCDCETGAYVGKTARGTAAEKKAVALGNKSGLLSGGRMDGGMLA